MIRCFRSLDSAFVRMTNRGFFFILPLSLLYPRYRTRELPLSSIDDDEIRKIPELESLYDTSHHDFPMRCIVIYHASFESFDLVFLIPTRVRFTIRDEDTRSIGELSMCMRYIIALKGDLSFLRYWIAESCQDIRHVTPRQSRVLESGKLRLICVFSDLVLSEVE